jgi:Tfp pilus assembly protein PilO
MANTRIWVLTGGMLIVVILVLGGLLGVKPQLDAARASDTERQSVEALNLQHQVELAQLKEEYTHIQDTAAEVAALRTSVPSTPDLDSFTGELAQLEERYGVVVTSYAPQAAAPFTPTEEVAAEVPSTIDATTLGTITIAITVVGTREATLAFVGALQTGTRLALVDSVNVGKPSDGLTSLSLTGLLYVLPDEPYVDPDAASTPAPTATAAG